MSDSASSSVQPVVVSAACPYRTALPGVSPPPGSLRLMTWLGFGRVSVAKRRPHSGQLWLAAVQRNASSEGCCACQSPLIDSVFQFGFLFHLFLLARQTIKHQGVKIPFLFACCLLKALICHFIFEICAFFFFFNISGKSPFL